MSAPVESVRPWISRYTFLFSPLSLSANAMSLAWASLDSSCRLTGNLTASSERTSE